jgi:hypothetical protein
VSAGDAIWRDVWDDLQSLQRDTPWREHLHNRKLALLMSYTLMKTGQFSALAACWQRKGEPGLAGAVVLSPSAPGDVMWSQHPDKSSACAADLLHFLVRLIPVVGVRG